MSSQSKRTPNALIHETSPYLRQHAYNPVQWMPWGKESLELAEKLQKPILLSIGYSTCHWCHVMERECFENQEIADLMNAHFINIKVDREERPDLDAIYMDAVQAMGLPGGWPLNVFLLPDRRPFYGGTYFPPQTWKQLLLNVVKAFKTERQALEEAAAKLSHALQQSLSQRFGLRKDKQLPTEAAMQASLHRLEAAFDTLHGGFSGAPKFPTPCVYEFMLYAGVALKQTSLLQHTERSLQAMYMGGLYDHVGGGFARYSVDSRWHVPHFEKMLYDNAQLIGLYAQSYRLQPEAYKAAVVFGTFDFLNRELLSPEGVYYAALDADSEGEEGKYYVWRYEEVLDVLKDDFDAFTEVFDLQPSGNWEEGKNVLRMHRLPADEKEFRHLHSMLQRLLHVRALRTPPARDTKILTAWNALLIKGLCEAYNAFGQEEFKNTALRVAKFIDEKLNTQGMLYHSYQEGQAKGHGLAEDYAHVIAAYIALYQVTFDERFLSKAQILLEQAQSLFLDEEGLYRMAPLHSKDLIANKSNLFDSVIPSENAVMAHNLFYLGILLEKEAWQQQAQRLLATVSPMLQTEVRYLAHWAHLWLHYVRPTAEVAIVGNQALEMRKQLSVYYLPHALWMGSCENDGKNSMLPNLKERKAINGLTTCYVCVDKSCLLPVHEVSAAHEQLLSLLKS
ncbi:hypothetical protein FHS56_000692 [Thermonema lapsum]|uniref:Spermatogenesis-associated protein 20-like TRX domain-containing protein n=1 Tax=Thermonema lapsum TaxID=28195 RepID=A0A846MNT6_9BACT|nr:thioredoxin domain-containing protein [Thermonema lapsum]NIK73206.1 hypothetical protein [Thermonema lapsum]